MEINQRLENAYGSKISDPGLSSEPFDASFFFIDMVGLSDPTLSVKNQVHKIEMLNELISSCDAYRKVSAGKKIIISAGDGMALGFFHQSQKFHLSLVFSFIASYVHITKGNLLHKKLESE